MEDRQSIEFRKKLGFFELPEPQKDYPVNYVLDGQQRLTSLFSVFQTELKPTSDEWVDIYFDLNGRENVQESLFLALDKSEVDLTRHFPVKTLFDSVAYRKATESLTDELIIRVDQLQDKFKSYLVPNITFETDDRNKVAIVFERINRAGTELNIFELLSAWSWSDQFDLVDKFNALQEKIVDHGFEELCNDRDLQLKVCAGVISGTTTPKSILDLKGEEIRTRFDEIEKGILGALDFLKREANIRNYKMLPFPALLVPLSAFFATNKTDGVTYSSKQKSIILKWFWRSLFSKRYSSDVNERQAIDIVNLLSLRADENFDFKFPQASIKFDFAKSTFSSGNANSKVLILLLNTKSPFSLLSGAKIDLDKVLKKGSKHEYHHIFPKNYLEQNGYDQYKINVLSNICFLTRSDNNSIRDNPPSVYEAQIDSDRKLEYLNRSVIPDDFGHIDFDEFILKRTQMLEKQAFELME